VAQYQDVVDSQQSENYEIVWDNASRECPFRTSYAGIAASH